MRNKKLLILIAVMLLVVFTVSLALVACKKTEAPNDSDTNIPSGDTGSGNETNSGSEGDDNPPPPPPIDDPVEEKPTKPSYATSFKGAVGYMVESMPSEYLSLNFKGVATVRGKRYVMALKGNLSDDDMQVSATFKSEESNQLAFAFYIIDSRLFIELEDGSIFNVAEIDANYLVSIIEKLPDAISGLLDSALGDIAGMIPSVLDLLLTGFAPSSSIVYEENDGVEKFDIAIDVQGVTGTIGPLVGKGGLVETILKQMNVDLDLSFIAELLNMIPLINGKINATVSNKILTEFKVELFDNDPQSETYRQTMLGLENAITFSSTALELDIPDGIKNYETLTLGNLNADFTLSIDTGGEAFDLGALIDNFLPMIDKNKTLPSPLFGEGVFVLKGDCDYKLDIKASLDPDLYGSKVDNNYINIVLRAGENELVRANYLDGKIYVKALGDGVNGFAEGGINVAIDFDLKGYVSQLVKLVTDAIDGFLDTQFRPQEALAQVMSVSVARDGEVILSPSVQDTILSILSFVDKLLFKEDSPNSFKDSVEITGNSVEITVDQKLFSAISEVAKLDPPLNLPVFGKLVIGLFGGGIAYVEVTAMDVLTLRADNFLLGKSKISRDFVEDSVGNINDYGSDVESVILNFALSLLSDLDLSIDLDLSTINTTVNLTPIVNNIMVLAGQDTYLNMPIALDLSKYDGTFTLRIATNYSEERVEKGKVIPHGNVLLELITPDEEVLISAYNEDSDTYVDLSGLGFMKFCLTNVNLFQKIRGLLGADVLSEQGFSSASAEVFNSTYTSGVEIDSDSVGVAINSYFVTTLMRAFSMDLGLDANLKAMLNFDGTVNAVLGFGDVASIGLEISLGKESESSNRDKARIKDVVAKIREDEAQKVAENKDREYGIYNAIGAEMLVDSILEVQNLNLTLDLREQNIDNGSPENKTRIVIRRSNAKYGETESLEKLNVPYKAIVFIAYSGWSASDGMLVYGYIDVNAGKMEIKIARNALSGLKLLEGISMDALAESILNGIELKFDLDIKTMLVGALSGLFESNGNVIEVPEGALPAQKPTGSNAAGSGESMSIETILQGISLTLAGNMDIDADVKLNGKYLSKQLKELLQGVFSNMNLESMGGGDDVTLRYDNQDTPKLFAGDLYDKIVYPMLQKNVKVKVFGVEVGLARLLDLGLNIDEVIKNLVARFLPLPNVQDMDVNVSLVDGSLANITLKGYNTQDYEESANDPEDPDKKIIYKSNLGFDLYVFNGHADQEVSWEGQDTNIYFNTNFDSDLKSKFVEKARQHTNGDWENESFKNIAWTISDDDPIYDGMSLDDFCDNIYPNAEESNLDNLIAEGVYTFIGTAFGKEIKVKLTLDRTEIDYIKDMQVKAMRDVPTYVTAVLKDDAKTEIIITDVNIFLSYGRNNLIDDETESDDDTIKYIKNARVTLGGKDFEFNINFEDEVLSLEKLVVNAYDFKDKLDALKEDGMVKVKVNDNFYRKLPAVFDFENAKKVTKDGEEEIVNLLDKKSQDVKNAATYVVDVRVGIDTAYECDMQLIVEFTPFEIVGIKRGGLDYIETDYLEYAQKGVFQDGEEITVVGFNGKEYLEYTTTVKWDRNSSDNVKGVTVDYDGGQYITSATVNEGEYNEWELYGIEVTVLPLHIVDLADSNKSIIFDWKYYYYGGIEADRCITSLLNFKTDTGVKYNVPVTIDVSSFIDNLESYFNNAKAGVSTEIICPVSIDALGKDGKSLFETEITVILPSLKMSLVETEVTIDVTDRDFNGMDVFFNNKKQMQIMLGDYEVTANVTWGDVSSVNIDKNGEYTVKVYIDKDGDYEQVCEYKVFITGNVAQSQEEV